MRISRSLGDPGNGCQSVVYGHEDSDEVEDTDSADDSSGHSPMRGLRLGRRTWGGRDPLQQDPTQSEPRPHGSAPETPQWAALIRSSWRYPPAPSVSESAFSWVIPRRVAIFAPGSSVTIRLPSRVPAACSPTRC